VILDIETPSAPKDRPVLQRRRRHHDLHDVKLGITNITNFAYLADGKKRPPRRATDVRDTPGNQGFSPRPTPHLIATYKIPFGGHAYSVGRALDRDRAVDESGNPIGVFGRVGARALSLPEQQQM